MMQKKIKNYSITKDLEFLQQVMDQTVPFGN